MASCSSVSPSDERAGLFFGQGVAEVEQLLEELLDVHAPGVVVGHQFLESFHQVDTSRVEPNEGEILAESSERSAGPLFVGVLR